MTHAITIPLWQRWRQAVRDRGWRATALYAVHRLLQRLHPRSGLVCYRFLVQPVPSSPRQGTARGQQYAFRLLTRPDPALAALGRPDAVIAARFAQGAHCLLASREQALAGCIWFVRCQYREDEVRVHYVLEPDCVWDFDVYVAPAERMGFLFAKQWEVAEALLRQRGTHYSVSRVNVLNRQSLASHRRLGARANGWALFLCFGERQLMLSSLPPYVSLGRPVRLRMRVKAS